MSIVVGVGMFLAFVTKRMGKRSILVGFGFLSGGRTRIWGFRPPVPPLKGGTPPLKLSCVRFDLCEAGWGS
jgi:hypothetical protein